MIQLYGTILLGGVNYTDQIRGFRLMSTREEIALPATFPSSGPPRAGATAGALIERVEMDVISGVAATSLWNELWTAITSDSGELAFQAWLEEGSTTSTANPKFSGTLIVSQLQTGGVLGSARVQTLSCPVTRDGVTKATS